MKGIITNRYSWMSWIQNNFTNCQCKSIIHYHSLFLSHVFFFIASIYGRQLSLSVLNKHLNAFFVFLEFLKFAISSAPAEVLIWVSRFSPNMSNIANRTSLVLS